MKSFQEFLKNIQEMKGDFGTDEKMRDQPVNCYGKTVKYKMVPNKKVCAFKRKR